MNDVQAYTVSQCFPSGRTRNWTNPTNGETVVFEMWTVEFREKPNERYDLSRTNGRSGPKAGEQVWGHFERNQRGTMFFKEDRSKRSSSNGSSQGNANGNGQAPYRSYRGGGSSTDRAIMAQVALKEAVQVTVAAQKFDPAYTDGLALAYMETMLKLSKLKVDGQDEPAPAPAVQFAPSNGSSIANEELPF